MGPFDETSHYAFDFDFTMRCALAPHCAVATNRPVAAFRFHAASKSVAGRERQLAEGRDFEFSFITKPLEPFRDHVVLITGLDATAASPTLEEPAGDHARGACNIICFGNRFYSSAPGRIRLSRCYARNKYPLPRSEFANSSSGSLAYGSNPSHGHH